MFSSTYDILLCVIVIRLFTYLPDIYFMPLIYVGIDQEDENMKIKKTHQLPLGNSQYNVYHLFANWIVKLRVYQKYYCAPL